MPGVATATSGRLSTAENMRVLPSGKVAPKIVACAYAPDSETAVCPAAAAAATGLGDSVSVAASIAVAAMHARTRQPVCISVPPTLRALPRQALPARGMSPAMIPATPVRGLAQLGTPVPVDWVGTNVAVPVCGVVSTVTQPLPATKTCAVIG